MQDLKVASIGVDCVDCSTVNNSPSIRRTIEPRINFDQATQGSTAFGAREGVQHAKIGSIFGDGIDRAQADFFISAESRRTDQPIAA